MTCEFNKTAAARFIRERVAQLEYRMSLEEISQEIGFTNPNTLRMIADGETKLPLDRIESFARALDCDTLELAGLAFEQANMPPLLMRILRASQTILTHEELDWLQELRTASRNQVPALTDAMRQAVRSILAP